MEELPPARRLSKVLVMTPDVLVASKVIALHERQGKPKAGTDWRDLAMLLLKFPDLKTHPGPVTDRLAGLDVDDATMDTWKELVSQDLIADEDEDGY